MASTGEELSRRERAELEALRARVAQLESERREEIARLHAALAAAQERTYWMDRANIDVNAIFESPVGRGVYLTLHEVRNRTWPARRFLRRVRGWLRSKRA